MLPFLDGYGFVVGDKVQLPFVPGGKVAVQRHAGRVLYLAPRYLILRKFQLALVVFRNFHKNVDDLVLAHIFSGPRLRRANYLFVV